MPVLWRGHDTRACSERVFLMQTRIGAAGRAYHMLSESKAG